MDNLDNNQPAGTRDVTRAASITEVSAVTTASKSTSLTAPGADGENMALATIDEAEHAVRRAARGYIAKGLQLVRLRPGIKRPVSGAWQNARPRAEEFRPGREYRRPNGRQIRPPSRP